MTTNTTIDAAAVAATLTAKGREFMRAVGNGEFSFFDGGIVAGEGSWGSVMSGEHFTSTRSASGVMSGTMKAGLWTVTEDSGDAGSWWALTEAGEAVALHLAAPEQPEKAALPAEDEPGSQDVGERYGDPVFEVVEAQQPDETQAWHGNYNTVFALVADEVAVAFPETTVWSENVSAMLRLTHASGPGATDFVAKLEEVEFAALAALRTWQKANVESRRDLTEMQKFNQHRAFLSGFGQAVAAKLTGKKVASRPVAFAKDMDKAMANAELALTAGKQSTKEAHA